MTNFTGKAERGSSEDSEDESFGDGESTEEISSSGCSAEDDEIGEEADDVDNLPS